MKGKELPGGAPHPDPAGKERSGYSASSQETHDPIGNLVSLIRFAAARGEPLAAGARVTVQQVRGDLYRVERP